MTVSSTTNRKTYAGDDTTTSFGTSPVVFFDTEDLTVYVTTDATGVATTLVEGTDYSATGGDGSTGTVDLSGGADPWGALASGTTLVIVRDLAITQESDFVNNDTNDAEVSEDALDRLTMIAQQLDARIDRSFKLADSDISGIDVSLPNVATRASKLFGFNAAGEPVVYATTTDVTLATGINFTAAGSGAVARSVQSKEQDLISVKDFGATGDGVTDDSVAIQAAMDAAAARGTGAITFGTVIFPAGTYLIGTQLEMNQQGLSLFGIGRPIIKWNGNNTTAMFHCKDSSRSVWAGIVFLGKDATPPTAAIYLDEPSVTTVGTNECSVIYDCAFGRKFAQEASPVWELQRGVWIGGASATNNDTFYIDKCQFHDCSTAGVAIDNAQSIWGSLTDVVFNACGYGLYTGANVMGRNLSFNRNTVADLHAFRDILVYIWGFNSEHSNLPISGAQGASFFIDGGKILLTNTYMANGDPWCSIATGNYLTLANLLVAENGVTGTKLDFTGSSANECNVKIYQCELPNAADGSGFVFTNLVGGLGIRLDIDHGAYKRKGFFGYQLNYNPASLADGAGASTSAATAAALNVTAGDLFIVTFSKPLSGVLLTGGCYQDDGVAARFQNESGGVVDIDSGTIQFRKVEANEIKAEATGVYDQALLSDGTGNTTTLTVPGAALGDFVVWSHTATAWAQSATCTAYVSAADTCAIRIQNELGGNLDPATGNLRLAVVRPELADFRGAVSYNPGGGAGLADGVGENVTIPLIGVRPGDHVLVSFSLDLAGVSVSREAGTDEVLVRVQNESGGAYNPGAGVLAAIVFKQ